MKKSIISLILAFIFCASNTSAQIVMTDGSFSTCSATFRDSGGASDYGENENKIFTFSPSDPNSKIIISFTDFGIEDGYDFLEVYDGSDASGDADYSFTGNNIPLDITATNALGSLTFKFTSDVSVVGRGWEATIGCVSTNTPPSEPLNLQATSINSATINVQWSSPSEASNLSGYRLQEQVEDGGFVTIYSGPDQTFEISNLSTSWYTYRVQSLSDQGDSDYSEEVTYLNQTVDGLNECSGVLNFDGIDDYVSLPTVDNSFTGDVTMEMWFKTSSAQNMSLFSINTSSGGNTLLVRMEAGIVKIFDGGAGAVEVTSNSVFNDGEWHHLAYSYEDYNCTLYIDQVSIGVHDANYVFVGNNVWSLGQEFDGLSTSDFFEGQMDQVRIWNTALSQAEINSNHDQTIKWDAPNLICALDFNEASGATEAYDKSKEGNHGLLVNMDESTDWTDEIGAVSTCLWRQKTQLVPIPNKNFSDQGFTISATTTTANTIFYSSSDPSVISLAGDQATIHAEGNVVISAMQAGDGTYRGEISQQTVSVSYDALLMANSPEERFCGARFQDTGGNSPYGINESLTMTIVPSDDGHQLNVNFEALDLTFNHSLKIFDGYDNTATQLASLDNNSSLGQYAATNVDGVLTFEFTSNGAAPSEGWDAVITCVPDQVPTTPGITYFTDNNSDVHISWAAAEHRGSAISSYVLERKIDDQPFRVIYSGLNTFFDYNAAVSSHVFRVKAMSIAGSSEYSTEAIYRPQLPPNDSQCGVVLNFDGVDDYVDISNVDYSFVDDVMTIEAWVKTSSSANMSIIAINTNTGGNECLLRMDNGLIKVTDYQVNDEIISNNTYNDNEWHHIAYAYDPYDGKLYVDGIKVGEHEAVYQLGYGLNLWSLGQEFDAATPSDFYVGQMDQVRIWTKALTDEEILLSYKESMKWDTPGLVCALDFNEAPGSTEVYDKSSEANHGDLINMNANTDWTNLDGGNSSCLLRQRTRLVDFGSKETGDDPFSLSITSETANPVVYTSSASSFISILDNLATVIAEGKTVISATQAANATYREGTSEIEVDVSYGGIFMQNDAGLNVCNTQFRDSGIGNNYSNAEDITMTLLPSQTGLNLSVDFSSLDLASGDILSIYDGTDDQAAQLASLTTGDEAQTYAASNNDGALTFHFTSDVETHASGWVAMLTCISTVVPDPVIVNYDFSTLTVAWTEPAPNGSAIMGYSLERKIEDAAFEEIYSGTNLSYEISESIPWENYEFRVIAYYAEGATIPSVPVATVYAGPSSDEACNAALKFDGIDDYVALNDLGDDLDGNTLTMEAWINTMATGANSILSINTASGGNVVLLRIQDGFVKIYDGGTSSFEIEGVEAFNDGQWHHVAYVKDMTQGLLYVDGILIGNHTVSYGFSNDDQWSIGQEFDGGSASDFYDGFIDEGRIWSKAMDINGINFSMKNSLSGNEEGLVAAYTFNESNGSATLLDITVKDNIGQLQNMDVNDAWYGSNGVLANCTVRPTIIVPAIGNKTYASTDFSLQANSSATGVYSYLYSIDNVVSVTNDLATIQGLGEAMIRVRLKTNDSQRFGHSSGQTVIVNKAILTVSANDESRIFGEANPDFTFEYAGFAAEEDPSNLISLPTVSSAADETSDAGIYAINVSGGTADNYIIEYTPGNLTINQATNTINFGVLANKKQGDSFELPEYATSGLTISYLSSNSSIAAIVDNIVTLGDAGSVTISATQIGNVNYESATQVDQGLTVESLHIWDGTNWNNGTPTATDDAKLLADYSFSTHGNMEVKDFQIESGVTLSIEEDQALIAHGSMLNSGTVDIASSGSLITLGSVSGTDYQIERITTFNESTGRYSIMGSPIEGAGFDLLGASARVYGYDQSELHHPTGNQGLDRFKTPTQLSHSQMVVGEGYFSAFTGDAVGEVTFTGTPNSGVITKSLAYTNHNIPEETDFQGFNLISNPYPSAINFDLLMDANPDADITGAIYLWDDHQSESTRGSNADYVIVNDIGSTDSQNGGLSKWDGNIRSAQGFFVLATEPTSLEFNNSMRVSGFNDAGGFYRTTEHNTAVKLLISNGEQQKATVIGFRDDATIGLDKNYDASVFNQSGLQWYSQSVAGGRNLGIQGLPTHYDGEIALGFQGNEGELFTISLAEVSGLESPGMVLLKDHFTQNVVNLKEESYTFNSTGNDQSNRFTLQVAQSVLSANDQFDDQAFFTYSTDGQLNVIFETGSFDHAVIRLIDLTGTVTHKESTRIVSNRWSLDTSSLPNQVYVLMIETTSGQWTRKVITK